MQKSHLIATLLIIFLSGCRLVDQPEMIPSFISIDSIGLQINNNGIEGTSNHAITDAWVYVDGNLEGIYELPASKIPLHYQGEHEIKLYAGIKRNGISADRKKYSFFIPYTQQTNLIADSIIPFNPTVEYESDLFIWIEDFEDPTSKLEYGPTSDTTCFQIMSSPANQLMEGDAGSISMDASNYYCELRTNELDFNDFPTNLNVPAYMELNYKCNHEFVVGILHKNNGIPSYLKQTLITLLPTTDYFGIDHWNKTYLYLPDATNFFTSDTEFDLYFSVLNNNGIDNIEIKLDNIKVIYRK